MEEDEPKGKYPRTVYAAIAIWVFVLALFALVGPLQLYGTAGLLALLGFAAVGFILWGE